MSTVVVATLIAFWTFYIIGATWITYRRRKARNGFGEASGDRDDTDLATSGIRAFSFAFGPGAGTGTGTGEGPGLKETTADVPLLGHKSARLSWSPGGAFRLTSVHGITVEPDADARCLNSLYGYSFGERQPHGIAPKADCSCGFYAVRTPEQMEPAAFGLVRLDVELSGRVVVYEKGYRAQHQRVLRVYLPVCWYCGTEASCIWLAESAPTGSVITTTFSTGTNFVPISSFTGDRPASSLRGARTQSRRERPDRHRDGSARPAVGERVVTAPSLFDQPTSRGSDPWTSRAAAARVRGSRQHLILAIRLVVAEADRPLTQFEIAQRVTTDPRWRSFGWAKDSVRTRCKSAGLYAPFGRTGLSPTGSRCLVFELGQL